MRKPENKKYEKYLAGKRLAGGFESIESGRAIFVRPDR